MFWNYIVVMIVQFCTHTKKPVTYTFKINQMKISELKTTVFEMEKIHWTQNEKGKIIHKLGKG